MEWINLPLNVGENTLNKILTDLTQGTKSDDRNAEVVKMGRRFLAIHCISRVLITPLSFMCLELYYIKSTEEPVKV